MRGPGRPKRSRKSGPVKLFWHRGMHAPRQHGAKPADLIARQHRARIHEAFERGMAKLRGLVKRKKITPEQAAEAEAAAREKVGL